MLLPALYWRVYGQSLEAGAVPVLVDGPEQGLVRELGLGLVWLPSWRLLPRFLLAAAADPAATTRHAAAVRRRCVPLLLHIASILLIVHIVSELPLNIRGAVFRSK